MRLMRGASVESGVVRVLFGVGGRRGKSRKSKVNFKVKNPILSHKTRQGWDNLASQILTGGTSPASTQATATSTSKAAGEGARTTHPQVTYKRLGEQAEAAFLAKVAGKVEV